MNIYIPGSPIHGVVHPKLQVSDKKWRCGENSWWRHQMEAFSALLAICAGNSPVPGEFPTQMPVTRSFDVYFDLCPNKRWVNKREAGDLIHNRAHYDVIVMFRSLTAISICSPGCPTCVITSLQFWHFLCYHIKALPKWSPYSSRHLSIHVFV